MARSVLSVIAGYAVMAVCVMAANGLMMAALPHNKNLFMAMNLVTAMPLAALGGYVTAWAARHHPVQHAMYLAGVAILMGTISIVTVGGEQPLSYQIGLVALMAPACVLGGYLRARRAAKLVG